MGNEQVVKVFIRFRMIMEHVVDDSLFACGPVRGKPGQKNQNGHQNHDQFLPAAPLLDRQPEWKCKQDVLGGDGQTEQHQRKKLAAVDGLIPAVAEPLCRQQAEEYCQIIKLAVIARDKNGNGVKKKRTGSEQSKSAPQEKADADIYLA